MRFIAIIVSFVLYSLPAFAQPKVDLAGDALPAGAYARFGSSRMKHDAKALMFLDADTLITFGETIRTWNIKTGKMKAEDGVQHMHGALTAAFSGDGKTLVTAHAPNKYRVWDAQKGTLIRELTSSGFEQQLHDSAMISVSRDGKRFVSNLDAPPCVWSLAAEPTATKLEKGRASFYVAVSADGSRVIATQSKRGEGAAAAIWATDTGKLAFTDKPSQMASAVALSADGTRFAVGGEEGWSLRTAEGKELWKGDTEGEAVAFRFTNDGQLVVVYESADRETVVKVAVVDAATGKRKREWSLPGEIEIDCAVSPDSKILAVSGRGRLRLWDLTNATEITFSGGHSNAVCTTCITPDGKFIASTDFQDKDVFLWDIATGRIVRRFSGHTAGCIEIVFSPNGKLLASSSYDRTVRVWEVASGKQLHKIDGFPMPVWHLRFLPDNESIAVAPQRGMSVSVYHAPSGKKVHQMAAAQGFAPSSLLRHPDGRILVIDSSATPEVRSGEPHVIVQVWDALTSRIIQRCDGHTGRLVCSILSPDGRTVATRGDDGYIRLWELATGQQRANIHEGEMVNSTGTQYFAFSPDGRTIASANRREPRVYLWDVVTGKRITSFPAHERPMHTLEFTPDGQKLITGSLDATLLGWDMTLPERRSRPLVRAALSKDDLTKVWTTLRDGSAGEVYKAKWKLVADPDATIALLRDKFEPAKRTEPDKIKTWLAELDSPKFPVREAAEKSLLTYFDQAEDDLRKAQDKATGEAHKRIARILEAELGAVPSPDVLRELRAVEILDAIGTKAALDVLRDLSPGKVRARVSRDATATLKRLDPSVSQER